jgi:hypothetical protein
MSTPSHDTRAIAVTHMVYSPQPLKVYAALVLRGVGKRDCRKGSNFLQCQLFFFIGMWHLNPLSTAVHEIS